VKKIDIKAAESRTGSRYPAPFHETGMDKVRIRLGLAAGLTQFGVNLATIRPGVWSSQRHWHSRNDEFVFVVSGELVLVTDAGEEVLRSGDCAGFKAGDPDGHHLINRTDRDAVVLEIGTDHADDICTYPDIDMIATPTDYVHRDGTPYPLRQD
jgi:uncharacterized cupin superfamily protein